MFRWVLSRGGPIEGWTQYPLHFAYLRPLIASLQVNSFLPIRNIKVEILSEILALIGLRHQRVSQSGYASLTDPSPCLICLCQSKHTTQNIICPLNFLHMPRGRIGFSKPNLILHRGKDGLFLGIAVAEPNLHKLSTEIADSHWVLPVLISCCRTQPAISLSPTEMSLVGDLSITNLNQGKEVCDNRKEKK